MRKLGLMVGLALLGLPLCVWAGTACENACAADRNERIGLCKKMYENNEKRYGQCIDVTNEMYDKCMNKCAGEV